MATKKKNTIRDMEVEGPIGAKTIGMLTAEAMVERIHNAEDQGQMHVLRDFLTSYLNISYTSDKDTILQALSEML